MDSETDTDVVVVGSGAAGLSAALVAATAGARVTVLEGSARWGGATAVSGGQVWAPGNHHMAALGIEDSHQDALAYLSGHTRGREPHLAEAFVRAAPGTIRLLEELAPLEFRTIDLPDSFAEAPGGRANGRNVEVAPVELAGLGSPEELYWPPPFFRPVLTNEEIGRLRLLTGGTPPAELIAERTAAGLVALGQGLVTGLLRGCLAAGVTLLRDHRVTGLLQDGGSVPGDGPGGPGGPAGGDGRVTGVRAGGRTFSARRGVVLACGGFEHDPALRARLLGGPEAHPVTPPVARGDALRLAGAAGAALAHPAESWSWPVLQHPGAAWADGTPRAELVLSERMLPHVIWVNAAGRRFVDESSHNAALAFAETDPTTGRLRNVPAWAIADAQHRARYPFAGARPGEELPPHAVAADTQAELAERLGIDPGGLAGTIQRFNAYAERGTDPDFQRGSSLYDRCSGDPRAPHPNLGTVAEPPFAAVPVLPGLVGTKGGPRTDDHARVLRWTGEPVPGLFAAGNATGAVIGPPIVSPGATIGSALVWGRLAGENSAG
ncbi:FAD-dependent oxidoreductase [Streptomyces cacaoi]|uniref:FAD-dependent oxidoreductase n=1 Tax=Streptomyces cacaoi TaxID=1898 RepID=UPI001659500D|nr:FAD-dependent oxidoreductase [Streptomyces cacaoi]